MKLSMLVCLLAFTMCASAVPVPQLPQDKPVAKVQLSPDKLGDLRKEITRVIWDSTRVHAGYTKPQINAVLDSLEARYNSEWRAEFGQEVTRAGNANGLTLTALHKKLIFSFWIRAKIKEELR